MLVDLGRLLAAVEEQERREDHVDLSLEPPEIIVSEREAVLVSVAGEAMWEDVEGAALQYALNTEWDLFRDNATGQLYLRVEDRWAETGRLDGVWVPTSS